MDTSASGCWADVYTASKFAGQVRRLFGPVTYDRIRTRTDVFGSDVHSARVGPGAFLMICSAKSPETTAMWFCPREQIDDIDRLGDGMILDSIRILDRPPVTGSTGYEAYRRRTKGAMHDGRDMDESGVWACPEN